MQWVAADDAGVNDDAVWDAMGLLAGIDSRHGQDQPYLYTDNQVREWLETFRDRCASSGGIPDDRVVTLWRPTGPEELALVEASDWRAWPRERWRAWRPHPISCGASRDRRSMSVNGAP